MDRVLKHHLRAQVMSQAKRNGLSVWFVQLTETDYQSKHRITSAEF